jgi:hypothetical protein
MEDPLVVTEAAQKTLTPMEQFLRDQFGSGAKGPEAGWDAICQNDVCDQEGREVAFTIEGRDGSLSRHRGHFRGAEEAWKSAEFTLMGQKGTYNANDVKNMVAAPTETFAERYQEAGWEAISRNDVCDNDWGREVAFTIKQRDGSLSEHRGHFQPSQEAWNSAEFTLMGQKGTYNANCVQEMVSPPFETFHQRYEGAGWTALETHEVYDMSGREVAFVRKGRDGRLSEHRGVFQAPENVSSAMFTLAGHKGEFNGGEVQELRAAPPRHRTGWQ